jgi:hypothetical protein
VAVYFLSLFRITDFMSGFTGRFMATVYELHHSHSRYCSKRTCAGPRLRHYLVCDRSIPIGDIRCNPPATHPRWLRCPWVRLKRVGLTLVRRPISIYLKLFSNYQLTLTFALSHLRTSLSERALETVSPSASHDVGKGFIFTVAQS